MDLNDTNNIVAQMYADAALRKLRPSCLCDVPLPGIWSVNYWTTCQKCQKQLSRFAFIQRGNHGPSRT